MQIKNNSDADRVYYITIKYTKITDTTDTPITKKIRKVTQVAPPVIGQNYSLEEQVIGTWFDKPLYRKTVELGTLPNNSEKQIAHNINNLDILVNCYGTAKDTNGNIFVFPNVDNDGLKCSVRLVADSTNLKVVTGSDRSGFSGYATIEYTKTTD